MFEVQDRGIVTRLGLLYYTKDMFTVMFSNICIFISLVNEAKYQAVDIILNENGISHFWKIHNLANNYSNLLLNKLNHCFL